MKVLSHTRYPDSGIKNIDNWSINPEEKTKVKQYIKLYESGSISGRLPTNPDALIERLLQLLRPSLENIQEFSEKGTEDFKAKLLKDKVLGFNKKTKAYNGKPYSLKTKKGIFATASKYFEWRFPDNPTISKPLNVRISLKENDDFETFSIPKEADILRSNCGTIEKRGIFALTMSGGRIEELMNLTESNIKLEGNFAQIAIKNNTSKTKGRTIKIYFAPAITDLHEFIKQRREQGMKPNEPLINMSYLRIKELFATLGKSINKKLTPHSARHSVATSLASKLNRQELCFYFGWRFSSNMPDKYISRTGFTIESADKRIESENILELKNRMIESEFQNKVLIEKLEKERQEMKKLLLAKLEEMDKRLGERAKESNIKLIRYKKNEKS